MNDRNRTGSGHDRERTCGIGRSWRVVLASLVLIAAGGAPARAASWNLFNIEGESTDSAAFATYATLADMLNDVNRLDVFYTDGGFVGRNVVGTGAEIVGRPPATVPEPGAIGLLGAGRSPDVQAARRARIAASSSARRIAPGSATPLPAMSNAVPCAGVVNTTFSPAVTVTP
jgi:hypothetical protein